MRKRLVVISVLVMAMFLSACSKNGGESIFGGKSELTLNDIYGKTSLTIDDLEAIDRLLLPKGYSYQTYRLSDGTILDSGDYEYGEGANSSLLLPIYDGMVSEEVVSSYVEKSMIYTKVDITLNNGKVIPVLYMNDVDSLKYIFATVYTEKETIMYTFNY